MKHTATMDARALAIASARDTGIATLEGPLAGVCPACGSEDFESILRAGDAKSLRSLIACSRCNLLRFIGPASSTQPGTFADSVHFSIPRDRLAQRLLAFFRTRGLRSKMQFLASSLFREGSDGYLLDCDGGDGTVARALEDQNARPLLVSRDPIEAVRALHRQGVYAVAGDPSVPPIRKAMFDNVCRLRGFAHEADPVKWLHSARALLRPGGRIVMQCFDSSSWAFLICGSQWTGLEASCSRYSFRAVDLEVMLDYCGFRITRRSHFFPVLNASIWVSSLFPGLDPEGCAARSAGPCRSALNELAYCLMLLAALPLGIVESFCHSGSVLMLEAEPK